MEDGVEFSGRTVEEAIAQAEARFGMSRDGLSVEVISTGSRGVFGIGAEPARILVRPERSLGDQAIPAAAAPAGAVEEQPVTLAPTSVVEAPQASVSTETVEEPAAKNGADLAGEASEVLQQLLTSMGFQAGVEVRNVENPLTLAVIGENLGVLIGRRGDNLAALQFMVNLILSKHRRQWPRVVVDVENYRARREESLRSLAERVAYRVRRNGRAFTLEAMPASDRRVIHLALRDRNDVETYSIGEGPARRVVVAPKRGRTEPERAYS